MLIDTEYFAGTTSLNDPAGRFFVEASSQELGLPAPRSDIIYSQGSHGGSLGLNPTFDSGDPFALTFIITNNNNSGNPSSSYSQVRRNLDALVGLISSPHGFEMRRKSGGVTITNTVRYISSAKPVMLDPTTWSMQVVFEAPDPVWINVTASNLSWEPPSASNQFYPAFPGNGPGRRGSRIFMRAGSAGNKSGSFSVPENRTAVEFDGVPMTANQYLIYDLGTGQLYTSSSSTATSGTSRLAHLRRIPGWGALELVSQARLEYVVPADTSTMGIRTQGGYLL